LQIAAGLGLAWIASLAASRVSADVLAPPPERTAEPAPARPPKPAVPAAPVTMGPQAAPNPAPPVAAQRAFPPMPEHADPVASYTLRASLDTAKHEITGKGSIVFRNAAKAPVNELYVHLYLNGFKNDRTVFGRFPDPDSFRGSGSLNEWGWVSVKRLAIKGGADLWPGADKTSPGDAEDDTDIRVPLPAPVAPGESLTLEVEFVSHLPSLVFRTGYFGGFHMAGQWFPKLARLEPDGKWAHFTFHRLSEFYADFGTYDVTVETPEDVVVGATGHLEGEVKEQGRVSRRFVQEDVHDFAFAAWDRFQELTALTADGIGIRVLYPPGHDKVAKQEIEMVRHGLAYLGDAFGRYPYKTVTVIHPPEGAEEAGGMEYPTLITTGGPWYAPLTGAHFVDAVTVHELGHQWFYGLVATDEHTWPFLDEGLNSYAETIALESAFPKSSAAGIDALRVGWPTLHRAGAIEVARNAPIAQPAAAFVNGGDYGALIYARTATILNTFAGVYGDEETKRAIGTYTRRYRFQHPGPEDLLRTVGEVLGDDAATQMRVALFEKGTVDYSVSALESQADDPPRGVFGDPSAPSATPQGGGEGYRGAVLVRRRGALRFPVDVDMIGADGTVTRVRWDGAEEAARLPYHGKTKLRAAVIDPDHKVLLDEDLSNNAKSTSQKRVSGALLDRFAYAAAAALSGVMP
jgi:hypothetical protein